MNHSPEPKPDRIWRRLLPMLFGAALCALFAGCQMCLPKVYPECSRKSLTELYYEAVAASQNTPDRNGSLITGNQRTSAPGVLPPAEVTDEPVPFLRPVPAEADPPAAEDSNEATIPLLPPTPPEPGLGSGWRPGGSVRTVSATADDQEIQMVSHSSPEPTTPVTEFFEETEIRQALQSLGPCPAHRRSFRPVAEALAVRGESKA